MITGFATIESAVAAVHEGAFDYLPKSFSVDQLRVAVERALRHRGLQVENRNLRQQLQQTLGLENMVGRSPAMTQVFELVKKAARSEANILVLGESGTGKELIARAIHANSPRASEPFVPVDCAALPGAAARVRALRPREGRLHRRDPQQARPRRGGARRHPLPRRDRRAARRAPGQAAARAAGAPDPPRGRDRRWWTSTCGWSRPPTATWRDAIAKGQFREDLYYRINVIAIQLPPLRERAGDVRAPRPHLPQALRPGPGRRRWRTPPWRRSSGTRGRATCASCRT